MKTDREQPIVIIRKKRKHSAHHGGAWKVAFADFMTSMMALFLVMWLVTQSSDIKSAVAGYFQDPLGRASEFGSSIIPGEGAQAANVRPLSQQQLLDMTRDRLRQMGEQIRRTLASAEEGSHLSDQIEVSVTEEGLRIELLEDSASTFFQTGVATPSGHGAGLLHLLGTELSALTYPVVVEGYTDATPFSRADGYTNWELSVDRANAARQLLRLGGLLPHQIVQVRGFADNDLKEPEHPFSPRNRRVTITMLAEPAEQLQTSEASSTNDGTVSVTNGRSSGAAP